MTADAKPRAHERFDSLAEEFETIRQRADALTQGLSDEMARWRPSPKQWSIAECLLHLNASSQGYLERLERACRDAPLAEQPPVQSTLFGTIFVWWMEPPVRIKLPAPRPFLPPPPSVPLAEIHSALDAMNVRLAAAAREAARHDFSAVTISSPISRKLRFRVGETFAFVAAHERRHLWQAARIRQAIPAA